MTFVCTPSSRSRICDPVGLVSKNAIGTAASPVIVPWFAVTPVNT